MICRYCSRPIIFYLQVSVLMIISSDWNLELHKGSGRVKEEYVYTHSRYIIYIRCENYCSTFVPIGVTVMDIREGVQLKNALRLGAGFLIGSVD